MTDTSFIVRDFMHETVSINRDGATFKDALQRMVEAKRNGIFVVDETDHVVGVLSAWDLIERVVPDYLELDKHLASFEDSQVLYERVNAVANDPIEDFMTKKVHVVHVDSPIIEVATMLSEFKLRMLPVVDKDGVLVGCINRTDVKLIFAQILNIEST